MYRYAKVKGQGHLKQSRCSTCVDLFIQYGLLCNGLRIAQA